MRSMPVEMFAFFMLFPIIMVGLGIGIGAASGPCWANVGRMTPRSLARWTVRRRTLWSILVMIFMPAQLLWGKGVPKP